MLIRGGIVPLGDFNDTAQPSAPFEGVLSAYGCKGVVEPSFHEYRQIIDRCCDELTGLLSRLADRAFKLWLFLDSGYRTPEQWARYPHFSLARRARDQGLIGEVFLETEVPRGGRSKRVGLYAVEIAAFKDVCSFLNFDKRSMAILSRRPMLFSVEEIRQIAQESEEYVGRADDANPPSFLSNLNYLTVSRHLCAVGDVVVKTDGAFDDKYRSVNLIYDPHGPTANVFAEATRGVSTP